MKLHQTLRCIHHGAFYLKRRVHTPRLQAYTFPHVYSTQQYISCVTMCDCYLSHFNNDNTILSEVYEFLILHSQTFVMGYVASNVVWSLLHQVLFNVGSLVFIT